MPLKHKRIYLRHHASWRMLGDTYGLKSWIFFKRGLEPEETQYFLHKYFYTYKVDQKWTPKQVEGKKSYKLQLKERNGSSQGSITPLLGHITVFYEVLNWWYKSQILFSHFHFISFHQRLRSNRRLHSTYPDCISSHYPWAVSCSRGWQLLPTIG